MTDEYANHDPFHTETELLKQIGLKSSRLVLCCERLRRFQTLSEMRKLRFTLNSLAFQLSHGVHSASQTTSGLSDSRIILCALCF